MDTIEQVAGCHLIRGIAFYLLCISISIYLYYVFIALIVVPSPLFGETQSW